MWTFSKASRDNLMGVHHDLLLIVSRGLLYSPIDFTVVEGVRSYERQKELFRNGASKTMRTLHLYGKAVDLMATGDLNGDGVKDHRDKDITWNPVLYKQIAEAMYEASDELGIPIKWGAGPRACQNIVLGAKARALFHGRAHVITDDIRAVAKPVLRHRVLMNYAAIDAGIRDAREIEVPAEATSTIEMRPPVPEEAPEFVQEVLGEIIALNGDDLPVSAFPVDGTYPTGTTQWEKRNIALEMPVWVPELCIQCGKCVFVCPHAVIRAKVYDPAHLEKAPPTF